MPEDRQVQALKLDACIRNAFSSSTNQVEEVMLKELVHRAVFAVLLATSSAGPLSAVSQAQEIQVPTTSEDHLALAKTYQEKAALYRKEAAYHRQMFEAYKKSVPTAGKAPGQNPWVLKMQKHCQMLTKDADKLASDAEKAAEFHTLRAKELQGK
jgi:hypothetical protein